MRKTGVRLHLDDDLLAWLREQAAVRRTSVSQVMRDLILAAMPPTIRDRKKR